MRTENNKMLLAFLLLFLGNAFALSPPIEIGNCPAPVFSKHCTYNVDYASNTLQYDISFAPNATLIEEDPNAGDYAVLVGTTMVVGNFSTYVNQCVNGAQGTGAHAIDLYADGIKVADNGWDCSYGGTSCFGGGSICNVPGTGARNSFISYTFLTQGLHRIKIVWDQQNRAKCGIEAEEFNVIVVNPVVSINASDDQMVGFSKNDSNRTAFVNWTITNTGFDKVLVKTVTATGCNSSGLSCDFVGFQSLSQTDIDGIVSGAGEVGLSKEQIEQILGEGSSARIGLIVDPGQSILVTERIVLQRPNSIPSLNNLSLHAIIGPAFTIVDLNKKAEDSVQLTSLFTGKEQFNIELVGGDQSYCIGRDGRIGSTGERVVPRVLLSWNWSDIEYNTCEEKGNTDTNSPYCDATQFTISLIKRLEKMRELAQNGSNISAASALTRFKALLMQDSFSEDFRNDFDFYYTEAGFFNAPAFYDDAETPWNSYLTNSSKLVFAPQTVTPGLYTVDIDVQSQQDYRFFDGSGPSAVVTVRLEKAREPAVANPLYLLPINGGIGLVGNNSQRQGYGTRFNSVSQRDVPITESIVAKSSSGAKTVNVKYAEDFNQTNILKRENLLFVDRLGTAMEFSPSFATPIAMVLAEESGKAEGYYYISRDNNPVAVGTGYGSLWTGFGSAPMQCKNFDNTQIFYRQDDSSNLAGTCADSVEASFRPSTFGYSYQSIPLENRNGRMFLETIFYTPLNSQYRLRNACSSNNSATFASPSFSPATGPLVIELNYKSSGNTIQSIFQKIASGDACVSTSEGNLEIWWNPQKLSTELNPTKDTMIRQSPTPVLCRLPAEVLNLPSTG